MRKIFEEYVESADYKISVFFKELRSQIEKWFSEGSLAAQGCDLDGEIQITNYNPMEKFLIANFLEPIVTGEDEEHEEDETYHRYRMTFMIRIDQMKGGSGEEEQQMQDEETGEEPVEGDSLEINKILLKIHQFSENNDEMGELMEEVDVEDIKEDFIIDKIGQLKSKSEGEGDVDDNDLKDNIFTK